MSLVKRARLVVAAGIVAVSGVAVVAPQVTAARNTEDGGGNSGCYEQLTEYKYQREVEVFKTEYLYKKQTKTVVTHDLEGTDQDSTELVSDWAWWDAITTKWSFEDVDVLESGDHWNWTESHDGHTDYYDRDYRYVKTGETRQVSGGTNVETTDWMAGAPDGDGWEQIGERTVKGEEIPCGEPPTYPPDVVEEWGDCASGDTEVTGMKTTTYYVAVYNYETDTWDKEMDGEPIVESMSRPLTEDEAEACAPVTTPPTTPETTPPTTPETTPPIVRIAAVTPLCHKDAPYVEVTFGGDSVFDGRAGTITFIDVNGTTVATHAITFAVGDTVQFLYPGATVDAQGNGTDWPGWKFSNGQWVPDTSDVDLRQGLTVVLAVNPTDTATVEYPSASEGCTLPENISANPVTPEAPDLSEFTLPETR